MARRPTLHDVASHAGVSIKTVSRVVNHEASVSEEVRTRVAASIAELHYVPNSFARSLKSGGGDTIGVVMDSIADPFFAELMSAVEARALDAGMTVIFGSTGSDPERERQQVERMAMQRVRALILAPVTGDHSYLERFRATLPIVMVDRQVEIGGYDIVAVDDRGLTRQAVDHLTERGHRRIAFVGNDVHFPTTAHRLLGYRDALAAVDVEPDPSWFPEGSGDEDEAFDVVTRLLAAPEPPTAVFAANPRAAMGAVHALHVAGRTDVAMISFGDFPMATTLTPAITCVNQDPHGIGVAATERVIAHLDAREHDRPDEHPLEIIVDTELVARGSGELEPA
ncbi:LacI family DNA-binding transcriptional regulator [Aeromicrobium terrae]|nr:LacI family DNA-binding transcriptional regulator [Aeromicrobium terrae]